jgi:hypothetical protein
MLVVCVCAWRVLCVGIVAVISRKIDVWESCRGKLIVVSLLSFSLIGALLFGVCA